MMQQPNPLPPPEVPDDTEAEPQLHPLVAFFSSLEVDSDTAQYKPQTAKNISDFEEFLEAQSVLTPVSTIFNEPSLPPELYATDQNLFQVMLERKLIQLTLFVLDNFANDVDFSVIDARHGNILCYALQSRSMEVFERCFEICLSPRSRFDWTSCHSTVSPLSKKNIFLYIICEENRGWTGDGMPFLSKDDIYFRIQALQSLIDFSIPQRAREGASRREVFAVGMTNPRREVKAAYDEALGDQIVFENEAIGFLAVKSLFTWFVTLDFFDDAQILSLQRQWKEEVEQDYRFKAQLDIIRREINIAHNGVAGNNGILFLLNLLLLDELNDSRINFVIPEVVVDDPWDILQQDLKINFRDIHVADTRDGNSLLPNAASSGPEDTAREFINDLLKAIYIKRARTSTAYATVKQKLVLECALNLQFSLMQWILAFQAHDQLDVQNHPRDMVDLLTNGDSDSGYSPLTAVVGSMKRIINTLRSAPHRIKVLERCQHILAFFIENGVDINTPDYIGATALQVLSSLPISFQAEEYILPIAKFLIEHGGELYISQDSTRDPGPIALAIHSRQCRLLQLYLELGTVPVKDLLLVSNDYDRQTPLEMLFRYGFNRFDENSTLMVRLLRENYDAQCGCYLYLRVQFKNDYEMENVKYLCETGIDVDSTPQPRMTPLMLSVVKNDLPFARYLTAHGAEPTKKFVLSTCAAYNGPHRLVDFDNVMERSQCINGYSPTGDVIALCDICGAEMLAASDQRCFHCSSQECDFDICEACSFFYSNVTSLDIAKRRNHISIYNFLSFSVRGSRFVSDNFTKRMNLNNADILLNAKIDCDVLYERMTEDTKLLLGWEAGTDVKTIGNGIS